MNAPLGGYGARMNQPAQGVHDRIFAKALVISDGTKKFAMITADMLGFPPGFKQAVVERAADNGWTQENVMLLASHSHTSIEMNAINPANDFKIPQIGIYDAAVFDFTVDNFARVLTEAGRELIPISVGTASQKLPGWNRNRRGEGGVVDDELTITRIDTIAGQPLAVLVNWTAHPTFMSEVDMWFSGGWPGHLQRTLETLIGDDVMAMYFNGAEGDQSPIGRPQAGSSHWERAECYGRDLGAVAWKQWQDISPSTHFAFAYHAHAIDLPKRSWHPDFMETGGAEYGLSEELLTQMLPRLFPAKTASISLRLGELLVVGIPGEMAADLGLKIKSEAAAITGSKHPVIGGLADVWVSYILSRDDYRRGAYEASVSFYGETLGERVVSGALEGVQQLIPKPNGSQQWKPDSSPSGSASN